MPSGQPSGIPSGQPSSVPSGQPSSIPSSMPSEQPSSQPSAQPSCTPSMSPTDPATMHLYYPDWRGGSGCLNDGNEPAYIGANPGQHMHSTLDSCCQTYFGWNFNECVGNLPGICARSLFYPDWDGKNEGCIDDGNEPKYMTDNAISFMFTKLEECCEAHYQWDLFKCVGKKGTLNAELFYPDWTGANDSCRNGGGQPTYMNNNVGSWMFKTLAECCAAHFSSASSKTSTCVGAGSTPTKTPGTVTGNEKYYPDWSKSLCINDGEQPSYMTSNQEIWMYDSLKECCDTRFTWNSAACVSSASPTSGTNKYYMDFGKQKCVKDCEGTLCGGLASPWDILYDSLKACCAQRNWWNDKCTISEAP